MTGYSWTLGQHVAKRCRRRVIEPVNWPRWQFRLSLHFFETLFHGTGMVEHFDPFENVTRKVSLACRAIGRVNGGGWQPSAWR
jgi:hypothetical protein